MYKELMKYLERVIVSYFFFIPLNKLYPCGTTQSKWLTKMKQYKNTILEEENFSLSLSLFSHFVSAFHLNIEKL